MGPTTVTHPAQWRGLPDVVSPSFYAFLAIPNFKKDENASIPQNSHAIICESGKTSRKWMNMALSNKREHFFFEFAMKPTLSDASAWLEAAVNDSQIGAWVWTEINGRMTLPTFIVARQKQPRNLVQAPIAGHSPIECQPREPSRKGETPSKAKSRELHVYIDGSCSSNGQANALASYAIWFGDSDERNRAACLDKNQPHTNSRAELTAAVKALEMILLESTVKPYTNITIYSDSDLALRWINYPMREMIGGSDSDLLLEIVSLLEKPLLFARVKAVKIQGRNCRKKDLNGKVNEAEKMAKKAIKDWDEAHREEDDKEEEENISIESLTSDHDDW